MRPRIFTVKADAEPHLRRPAATLMLTRMSSTARRIREARKRLGLKQAEFAQRLGVSQTSISRWESGQQEPDFKQMMEIGTLAGEDPIAFALLDSEHNLGPSIFGTPTYIVGSIQKGIWREGHRWDQDEFVSITMPMEIPAGHLVEAYVVKDNSCEPRFAKDTILFVADVTNHLTPKDKDLVLFIDYNKQELTEVTIKEISLFKDMSIFLNDIDIINRLRVFEAPVAREAFRRGAELGFRSLGIRGIVIASFANEAPGRLPEIEPEDSD